MPPRSLRNDVREAALRAATSAYLAGEPIDMKVLAAQCGVGRATLYRHVGSRDQLLAVVLEQATIRTFNALQVPRRLHGTQKVIRQLEQFMVTVVRAEPIRALIDREPVVFMRLVLGPGLVEEAATRLVQATIEAELGGDLQIDAALLAQAIVRVCDSLMYAHLLNNTEPALAATIEILEVLLRAAVGTAPPANRASSPVRR